MKIVISDYHQCSNCDGRTELHDILNEKDGSVIATLCMDCINELYGLFNEI